MKTLPFKLSPAATVGVELELQIINPKTFGLTSRSKDLIRNIQDSSFAQRIKPEITQSMIEINSSIHHSSKELMNELMQIRNYLLAETKNINIMLCGGGTHPFQKWALQKIFPSMRYINLSSKFGYLSKRATVFGQHIHVGCKNGDDAIYLTQALTQYAPHFIAICASSPYYQGVDTGYCSARSTIFNSFPSSGVMPYFENWENFTVYFYKMQSLGIIETMKDVYWDIRPKPEFGTVEIRVCDTPLTIHKAVLITAYIQALSLYLLENRPFRITPEMFYLYGYNRFQASRYGYNGEMYDYNTSTTHFIKDHILETLKHIERYSNQLDSMGYISQLVDLIINLNNDSVTLRKWMKHHQSYQKVVEEQCLLWAAD